jgi:hypothetical protein
MGRMGGKYRRQLCEKTIDMYKWEIMNKRTRREIVKKEQIEWKELNKEPRQKQNKINKTTNK